MKNVTNANDAVIVCAKAEEIIRNYENRFGEQGYKKAIEWLACFMIPGKEDLEMFGDCVDFVASKYSQGINTVAFDVTVYLSAFVRVELIESVE